MAEGSGSNSTAIVAIVAIVVLIVGAFFAWNSGMFNGKKESGNDVHITVPNIPSPPDPPKP